jgi:putative toxin-antitoxin system antitoxin component (TIGR02293 family)
MAQASLTDLLGPVAGSSRADTLRARVRAGLPFRAFETLLSALDLGAPELGELVGVAPRTLARRKAARRLSPIESDRLYRVAQVALLAIEVLGSLERARTWLHQENRALGGVAPLHELDTEIGARRVEEVLQRLAFGIHS